MNKLFASLPLEERLAALGTSVFVVLGLIFATLQYQQNASLTNDITAQLGGQISRQLASQVRYDTFNGDALSLTAILQETLTSPLLSRAAIVALDGDVIVAADKDLPYSVESDPFRSEIATEDNVIGYAEVILDQSTQLAQQRHQWLIQAALLFASSLLCYLALRLLAVSASHWLRDIVQRYTEQQAAPDYPHNDAMGALLIALFGEPAEVADDNQLSGRTVIAVRVHDWSKLNRQLDRALLEQIARQLEHTVSAVADRLMLQWEPAAGGFDLTLAPHEFDAASATDTLVAASLILRLQHRVAQQRMREGKVDFTIAIGIGEMIPPSTATQRKQPTLVSQMPALAKQQAHYLASMAEENSISVSERFVEAWSLASALQQAKPAERTRAALSCEGLLPPYDDIVELHLKQLLSAND
ncbi:MAG TPA: hypothetical protein VLA24_04090 [Pseudomonadales bacterium]|nr:hypothetical protein [Pseudomonadales bacterium]